MKFYCAGNWKMNKGPGEAVEFIRRLKTEAPLEIHDQLVILPPALAAFSVSEGLCGSKITWGAQNCYCETHGAFTGENSPKVLSEMGASFSLAGHSERRQLFGETDELIAKKVAAIQKHGMTPILCVGETLAERQSNRTQEVILRQLNAALQKTDPAQGFWLAYEPVWAIGTGQVATTTQVEEAHSILRGALGSWNRPAAERTPILYGGSVKPENAAALASLKNVNGFLIGGASLEVADFLKIAKR